MHLKHKSKEYLMSNRINKLLRSMDELLTRCYRRMCGFVFPRGPTSPLYQPSRISNWISCYCLWCHNRILYNWEGERRNSLSHLQACQNNFIFRFLAQIQLFENLLTCIPTNESWQMFKMWCWRFLERLNYFQKLTSLSGNYVLVNCFWMWSLSRFM